MGIEKIVAKEAISVIRRRPEKFRHVAGLYLVSLADYEVGRLGRASYFFFRYVDDLLDGDRRIDNIEPFDHIASIRHHVEEGDFTGGLEILSLVKYSLDVFGRKARSNDNPKQDFLDMIDIMVFDNQRRQKRKQLTREQLSDYYRLTFNPVHNLMLIGLNSQLRASDISEFSQCQGRVYSVEHLEDDWNAGIINIPEEILTAANLTSQSSYKDIKDKPIVKKWTFIQLQKSKDELLRLQVRLQALPEKLTFKIYNTLIRSMLKFIERYSQEAK